MDNNQATKAYNDNNVYILGAGFGAEAGLPLIKDFMNRMRDAAAWLEEQGGREPERQAIERVLKFRLSAAAAAYRVPLNVENVEELFSLASASGGQQLAQDMTLAIAATLDYARNTAPPLAEHQYFTLSMLNLADWTKPPNWKPPPDHVQQSLKAGQLKGDWYSCPPYEFYLGVMCGYFNKGGPDRHNTIITFNYDTTVEDALRHLGITPNYGFPNEIIEYHPSANWINEGQNGVTVAVLKPHGSVNWAALWPEHQEKLLRRSLEWEIAKLSDEGIADGRSVHELLSRYFRDTPFRRLHLYGDYPTLRSDSRWAGSLFLVPPTWHKGLGGHLAPVWDQAVSAIRTATRVIILGYSIPTTDQHFRYLLAAGLQENISLRKVFFVNPALAKEEERTQLEVKLFGLFRREHFEQGVIELVPRDVRSFLAGPHNSADEKYRLRIGRPLSPLGSTWDTAPWTINWPFPPGSSSE